MPAGDAAAIGSTNRQTADVKQTARAVTELGRFVHDLIEGREDIVSELDLGDRH